MPSSSDKPDSGTGRASGATGDGAGRGAADAGHDAGATPDPDGEAREQRISEIVLAAAACEPEEQEAFLRRATVDDPGLLEEARRRLRQAAELPSAFLAMPAAEILEAPRDTTEPLPAPDADVASSDLPRVPAAGGTSRPSIPGGTLPIAGAERYELGECIGRGGMSRVFRAFDRQLGRPVALKLLERADPKTLRRFQREAQIQAKVRHEYVLEIYETGDLGGQPFIAMYYVDGPTLMDVRDRTSLAQKVRLMAQVAEGLDAAHREGLIHRDVKPSNILVETTADGRLKPRVADFGIATGLGDSSMFTAALAGTPYYIAPERLHEDDRPVDRRSDIYSLGVTIFQLLTGKLPFDHPGLAEMLRQIREDQPPSLRHLSPSLPAAIDAIVTKCLAKDPDARYPTARAVAEDLWRFIDGKPVEAYDRPLSHRLARSVAHGRSLPTGLLIAAALLIALLAGYAVRTSSQARRVAFEVEQAQLVAVEAEVTRLASAFHDQGRYADAEPLYRRALELREQRLGPTHSGSRHLLERLASLYESWGRSELAAETRAELEGLPPASGVTDSPVSR